MRPTATMRPTDLRFNFVTAVNFANDIFVRDSAMLILRSEPLSGSSANALLRFRGGTSRPEQTVTRCLVNDPNDFEGFIQY